MAILISHQGHSADAAQAFANSLSLWYITLPIMARYNIGYNFNVHLGIQLAFLLSATSTYTNPFDGEETKDKVTDQFKTVDFGIPVGVGYEFMDRKLKATARYIIPLTNIADSDSFKLTNSVFQLSLGIMLFRMAE